MTDLDQRQEEGRQLARQNRIRKLANGKYTVPSVSKQIPHELNESEDGALRCDCLDYTLNLRPCKHIWALTFARQGVAEGEPRQFRRLTYRQAWPQYNAAQVHEKEHVLTLLRNLCDRFVEDEPRRRGQTPFPKSDRIFVIAMKVYEGMSARRGSTDMRALADRGLISRPPSYNSVIDYFDDAAMTPILRQLVQESAAPLASLESTFAPDSSGFSTCTYERWYDAKYGHQSQQRWLKAHVMVGVKTNVITSAIVTDGTANDAPFMAQLLAETRARFQVQEVVADKGYLSQVNMELVEKAGAHSFIPFKITSTGTGRMRTKPTELWTRLFHYFSFRKSEFLVHYNKRSNVESTFSAVKRKLGGALRSRTRVAQENELLAKILCFNLGMLVHETYELGVAPLFWAPAPLEMIELPEVA